MTFDPNDHISKLPQGKDKTAEYLEVKWRLVWFRDQCSEGTINTELVTLDLDRAVTAEVSVWNDQTRRKEKVQKTANGWCLFKATVADGKGGRATAHGSESAVDFGDYIEKAETKAVGRALAYLGYGTQFAPELNEGERIVDTPVLLPSAQPADVITAPVPSKLRTMFVSIGTTLETAEKLTFKRVVNDLELTPEECFQLHQVYDAWKKRFEEKQAKAS
jgi:hypothetical protein